MVEGVWSKESASLLKCVGFSLEFYGDNTATSWSSEEPISPFKLLTQEI